MMLEAYQQHRIPHWFVFRPFFDWKQGLRPYRFSPSEVREMRKVALALLKELDAKHPEAFDRMGTTDSGELYFPYDTYGEDKVEVYILNQINEELTNYLILSMS